MKIGLVLGSGAARGLSHIGVLKHLESIGIYPDIICGSSIGAIIGGAYASGMSINEMEKIAIEMKGYKNMIKFLKIKKPIEIFKKDVIEDFLKKIIKEEKIENFPIKFACNATDIRNGKEIVFTNGNAIKSIRASMSIPGIFKPIKYKKRILVDGGVTNPVPAEIAEELGADKIIAVDVNSKIKLNKKLNLFSTIENAIEIMQMQLSIKDEINYKNTLVLKPNISSVGRFDFINAKKVIDIGYRASKRNEKKIKEFIFGSSQSNI